MDKNIRAIFAANLKRYLALADKTQADLARFIGVSSATASDWCNGNKMPRTEKLNAIAKLLNTTPQKLMGWVADDPDSITDYYEDTVDLVHRIFKENGYTDISQESPFCVFTSHDGDVLTFHEGDLVHRVEELRLAEQPITFLALANTHSDFTPEEQERLDAILATVEKPSHYLNPETAKVAQELFDDPNLRVLFDAAKNSRPEDLRMAADLLKRLKATNPDG